ncbi:ATP-binding protein [Phytohabitans aurantiacus]|uniref:Recombinase domain-containing protein n=1 Tax=Phytohabitans aurantiacus TaxID=3016789 RepID=A0ABQ5R271_9ACTN|nr:ATP-binding protein [Phytohabitans aurantiacus]GLI00668.1 hypothetical protein Pa4123_59440 [Phytohabitans aurantiacus]
MTESTSHRQAVTVPAVANIGTTCQVVYIEATPSAAATAIAGVPDTVAQAALDRIRTGTVSAGLAWPNAPIALRVHPHALPDGDPGLDAAFAVAALAASGQIAASRLASIAVLGALNPAGALQPLQNAAARLAAADRAGLPAAAVPAANLTEASLAAAAQVHGAATLKELVAGLRGQTPLMSPVAWPTAPPHPGADLADLPASWSSARRVLEIAAAGGHHLLLIGPAATAAQLAERLPRLLPNLDPHTATGVAHLHRQAGTLPLDAPVRQRPPWQAPDPHDSVPDLAGTLKRPGAVSLAHAGVLWCANADLMSGRARDVLRLILDQRRINAIGARRQAAYPAAAQLLLSATGCQKPATGDGCGCPQHVHNRILARLGPLFDRVDIHYSLPPTTPPEQVDRADGPPPGSAIVAARVAAARANARAARRPWHINAEATAPALREALDRVPAAWLAPLRHAQACGMLSPRGTTQVLRLAFTIADLAGRAMPNAGDLADANCLEVRTGLRCPMRKRPAAKYRRISRDREGRELGIERQDEDLDALADKRGLVWVDDYFDNDLSASTNSRKPRPDYDRMLRDAKAGKFEVIAAYTTSRLTRRPREFEDLIDLARDHGIEFQYIRSPEFDLTTAQGRGIARTLAARDAEQAETTAELVQRAHRQRAEMGEIHGGQTPYGFTQVWDRGKLVTYVENTGQADIIREAYDRILAGEGLGGIAADWQRRGIATARGAKWTRRTIQSMVIGPSIAGYREHNGDLFEAKWPPLVDRDDWTRVREIVGVYASDRQGNHKPRTGNGNARKYALSGLVFHAAGGGCGRVLYGCRMPTDKRPDRYGYVCTTPACRRLFIDGQAVERFILDQVCEVIDGRALAAAIEADKSKEDPGREIRTAIADDERRLQRVQDEYDDDQIPQAEYRRRRDRLTTRLDDNRRKLADLSAARVVLPTGDELRAQWPTRDAIWKRTILGAVIRRVTVGPMPKGMASHLTQRRTETDDEYAGRLDLHRATVLAARVKVEWLH